MVRQRGALQYRLDAVMTTPTLIPSKLTRALLALLLATAATIASAQESRPPAQHGEQRERTAARGTTTGRRTRERVAAVAGGLGDRAHRRDSRRHVDLYRDRGNALAVRSIGRAVGRGLLQDRKS